MKIQKREEFFEVSGSVAYFDALSIVDREISV